MTRLSSVLDATDLPIAELWAARLDGELFTLDDCFLPVDLPEGARERAAAIARQWPQRLIAEQHTAAWIWGVLMTPPSRHELCASLGARARPSNSRRVTVREVVIDDDDIATVGGVRVTTPLRCILDLARFSTRFDDADSAIVLALATLAGLGIGEVEAALERRRNLPNKRIARTRLRAVFGVEESA